MKEAMLYEKLADKKVHCYLCSHHCQIAEDNFGICRVRQNRDGVLYSLVYAKAVAASIDPIAKKPLYHFHPGSKAYSIATKGCNFKCGFCQNWQISQLTGGEETKALGQQLLPEKVVDSAKKGNCLSIAYTYTEPTIFFEYALDTAKLAKTAGLDNIFVTNGYMTKQALELINPYLDAANVDLKSFRNDFYQKHCQAELKPVLDSIKLIYELGIWLEITTLIVPGTNDSVEELSEIANFIAGVSCDIPWHISCFYPNYKFLDYQPTPEITLNKAYKLGKSAGLRYIYLGNILEDSNTYCYNCQKLLIKRIGFELAFNKIKQGKCSFCQTAIQGVFN